MKTINTFTNAQNMPVRVSILEGCYPWRKFDPHHGQRVTPVDASPRVVFDEVARDRDILRAAARLRRLVHARRVERLPGGKA